MKKNRVFDFMWLLLKILVKLYLWFCDFRKIKLCNFKDITLQKKLHVFQIE